jgi:hypothetical protein
MIYNYICKRCGVAHITDFPVDSVYCPCAWRHIEVALVSTQDDEQSPAVAVVEQLKLVELAEIAQNLAALFATFSSVSIYDLGDRFAVEINLERKLRRYYGATLAIALRNTVAIAFG